MELSAITPAANNEFQFGDVTFVKVNDSEYVADVGSHKIQIVGIPGSGWMLEIFNNQGVRVSGRIDFMVSADRDNATTLRATMSHGANLFQLQD